ncbi:hypothetical protein KEM09_03515 [Carboxylicivirga mesophila]|uniref:Uncharacterized protein n=1 Tax=Carboxylicivirga mesophila TaxID=1166478 RepID=A0ABS5K7F9_9BACT|nr:hypothetical protein [Carboxylicivirga mesophila]MBS2210451.1 hypothetical protein [Carboxylicivirga mesophila]
MKFKFTVILFLVILKWSYCQSRNLPIESIPHISIDSIFLYDDPYIITNGVIEDYSYSPVWLEAFCAITIPTYFNRNVEGAIPYLHSSLEVTKSALQKHYSNWHPSNGLVIYILGDIYFHDIVTNDKYIKTPIWVTDFNHPVCLSLLDTAKLGQPRNSTEIDSCDAYSQFYQNDHGAFFFYKYESHKYKKCRERYLYEVLKWDINAPGGMYKSLKGFIELIEKQDTFTRSRVVNDKRIFETVNNTPDGPVVVKPNDEKKETNSKMLIDYWWALLFGAVLVILVVLLMRKRK